MQDIEKHISQYVESQFPEIYREEGPQLVRFVTAYYEWMESTGQPLFHARRLPSYRDIDTTLDEFVTHFKLKYLPNIQFTTASSRRLFVKNALDFHRSKGSSRSVDLFFKLIYGISANIYYPGDDLFKASDGQWIIPVYLEISPSPRIHDFIGQTVTGVTSFATAFVESYNRIRIKGKYINVLYLSDVQGVYIAGEILKTDRVYDDNPRVEGSVTSFAVLAGGASFTRGERVGTISDNGQLATGIVTGISDIVGAANVELIDGGFGYNSTSEIIISDKTLTIGGLSNTGFVALDVLQERYANGDLASTADIVGTASDHIVTGTLTQGDIFVGQTLRQGAVSGTVSRVERSGTNLNVSVENINGFFKSTLLANTATGAINVGSYSTLVGIANVSGPGSYTTGNQVVSVQTGQTGLIQASSQTSNGASFKLGANTRFSNQEVANVNLDYIKTYANTRLNAVQYNMPKAPTGNVANMLMIAQLSYEDRMYGTITNSAITSLYGGSGYSKMPFILIKEALPYDRRLGAFELLVGDQQSSFMAGEKVVTGTLNSNGVFIESSDRIEGIVIDSVDDERVRVKRLSVQDRFYEHDPQNYAISGETSGASARIRKANVFNEDGYVGLNANIDAQVFTSAGLVTTISMETSGYGYSDKEIVTFFSLEDPTKTGLASLRVLSHGLGAGYYGTRGGSLSANKFLQDNHYYQDFSYEIQTSIEQHTYKQMFDQVLHVAGTKGFSSYLSETTVETNITIAETALEVIS